VANSLSAARQEPVPELTEHGTVEARIGQFQPEQVLPINTGSHRLRRLTVGEVFAELQNGDECETPGRQPWLATAREERGEIGIRENRAEGVTQGEVGIPMRKRRARYTGRVLGDSVDGLGFERHSRTSEQGESTT
jgi:hypothetical protein